MYKLRRSTSHEYFSQAFIVEVDRNYPFKKQDNEVEEIRWFMKDEIINSLKEKPEIFIKSFREHMDYFLNNGIKSKKTS